MQPALVHTALQHVFAFPVRLISISQLQPKLITELVALQQPSPEQPALQPYVWLLLRLIVGPQGQLSLAQVVSSALQVLFLIFILPFEPPFAS